MTEKMTNMKGNEAIANGQSGLKKALVVFAIIEALVLIPLLLYMVFR